MTVVGKILVFVNLLFSLAVAALIVMVFVARTNWAAGYEQMKQRNASLDAEAQTLREETRLAIQGKQAEALKYQQEINALKTDLAAMKKERDDLATQIGTFKETATRAESTAAAAVLQVQKRDQDVRTLEAQLTTQTTKANDLLTDNNKLREQKTNLDIQVKALLGRNQQIEEQLETVTKQLVKAQTGGGAATTTSLRDKNPPAGNVEGVITRTGQDGLVQLSIGSDAGLIKNHTLEVFRLNPPKYLGTIRVMDVTAHTAVGQPVSKPLSPLQQGDRVASKILGN
jgi:hypothetical protein